MNWSARGNVLNQYLRNTSIGTTVIVMYMLDCTFDYICFSVLSVFRLTGFYWIALSVLDDSS